MGLALFRPISCSGYKARYLELFYRRNNYPLEFQSAKKASIPLSVSG
jgi:hypothetical protein